MFMILFSSFPLFILLIICTPSLQIVSSTSTLPLVLVWLFWSLQICFSPFVYSCNYLRLEIAAHAPGSENVGNLANHRRPGRARHAPRPKRFANLLHVSFPHHTISGTKQTIKYRKKNSHLFSAMPLPSLRGDGALERVGGPKHLSRREARPRASSWQPRLHARARRQPEALRSLTATGQARSPCVRSVATKNQPSCSSASCPSSVWCARSPRTSRPICVSRAAPWWPCRRRARPTWSDSSRTQTCAQSTQSASQSCPRTSSWHVAFAVSALKRRRQPSFV